MAGLKKLFGNKTLRAILVVTILLVTIFLFVRFFIANPQYLQLLRHIRLSVLLAVIGLNAVLLAVLVVVYDLTLQLCGSRLGWLEQFQLTAYSAIVNFFGPLQSGPGVRAVYLKTQRQVRLRDYTLATLIYYGFFALFNALFLFGGSRPWWQTIGGLLIVVLISVSVIRWFSARPSADGQASGFRLNGPLLFGLATATFVQVCLLALCYFVELRAVSPTVSLHQAIIYSGAANFALFVSLTPDAIGFRESFLILSRHLHHISTAVIVSANVIDRGGYVVFLLLLFVIVLATHVRERLKVGQASSAVSPQ